MPLPTTPEMRRLAFEMFREALRNGTLTIPSFDFPMRRYIPRKPRKLPVSSDMAQMLDDIERAK